MTVRAIFGHGFNLRPWLPLAGGLVFVGYVCNRAARMMARRIVSLE